MGNASGPEIQGVTVEVKIGIQNVAREIVLDATGTEDEIEAAVTSALDGGALVLTDDKGRRIMVPAGALGYVEVGEPTRGRVGFGAGGAAAPLLPQVTVRARPRVWVPHLASHPPHGSTVVEEPHRGFESARSPVGRR